MADTDRAKNGWVLRVLGIEVASGDAAARPVANGFAGARTGYTEAMEAINGQITALQNALRSSRDNDLVAIAEFGLNGVTGNHSVRLTAALMDIGAGPPTAKTAQKAIGIIAPFREHIASDERITVCDENPFGVAVAIRSTLEPALAALQTSLEDALV